ncbi:MAG: hypothetical protein KDJ38_02390 [Gammaproteobacteria bacterium]|nr:hypothetical protein [Gammaproteobacteria bacterium]
MKLDDAAVTRKLKKILGIGMLFLTTHQVSLADDIEVYGSNFGTTDVPNVLFIIDNSESMTYGTDGNPASWSDSKAAIMQEVFKDVLADSAGKINAGVILFNSYTSGVKWPISDLTSEANLIDPGIPAGITVEEVLGSIVDYYGYWGQTNYLSALTEAVAYFRGDKVWYNGWQWPTNVVPQTWNTSSNRYTGGSSTSPNPYTYLPHDAYVPGSAGPDPKTTGCWNGQPYDPSASNNCAGKELVPDSCVYYPETTYTPSPYCPESYVCTDPPGGSQGECNAWSCPVDLVQGPDQVSPAHDICRYYIGSWVVPDYQSPIGAACQGNYIILLSDGIPTINNNPYKALDYLGYSNTSECEDVGSTIFGDASHNEGNCSAELLEMLNTGNQIPGLDPSNVTTYTIGFGLIGNDAIVGKNYLQHLANKGGGQFFESSDYATLSDSLKSIINAITGEVDDFTGLSIDVKSNAFSSDNRAFINLFTPSEKRIWEGNVKGYFLAPGGLQDTNGIDALDADGKFKANARSFWSSAPDGAIVSEGGLSEKLRDGNRTLYTYTGSADPVDVDLNTGAGTHLLTSSNPAITTAMLGVPDSLAQTTVLDWVQTAPMADPLHSTPVIARYAAGEVLFTMTNQGFLHAIDAATPTALHDYSGGEELFAFMPQDLLPNLSQIKSNLSAGAHIYGLDGGLTFRHDDTDGDRTINNGEKAILYFGMRRGGDNYYALDVSDITHPKLLWQIKGGTGDFAAMGQSWSRMVLTTLRVGGNAKKVLIFGGGYDTAEDARSARAAGAGNRVYVVDADSGALLWSVGAGSSHLDAPLMQYSIPSDIAVIDLNGNGYADHLYFGDMGGQLWRVGFSENVDASGNPTVNFSSSPSVSRIGDFGSAANRRFHYAPAIALMREGGTEYLAVTIGSGDRAHPLNTSVDDWIFMVRDPINTPLSATVTMADLYDVTQNLVAEGSDTAGERAALALKKGWKLALNGGEKSLSRLVIFDNKLRFTTFEPTSSVAVTCGSNASSVTRYYVMNLTDATPSSDKNVDESTLTREDRSTEIDSLGIASSPTLVFPVDGNTVDVYVGKENVGSISQKVKRIYWRQFH